MINNKKIVVVMPAYNAEKTLIQTYNEIPLSVVDDIILVDDKSSDKTIKVAESLGIKVFQHEKNMGYGANQKTCYREALNLSADVVVMLHPDYQYNPKLITAMSSLVAEGIYDTVIASRILGGKALAGGMPVYKYLSNRALTLIENLVIREKISEYHTGYRVFSRKVIESLPLLENSDDFIFDNQMLLQILFFGFTIGEISCPTVYRPDSSSINFQRSVKYGLGVLLTGVQYSLAKMKIFRSRAFNKNGKKLFA